MQVLTPSGRIRAESRPEIPGLGKLSLPPPQNAGKMLMPMERVTGGGRRGPTRGWGSYPPAQLEKLRGQGPVLLVTGEKQGGNRPWTGRDVSGSKVTSTSPGGRRVC